MHRHASNRAHLCRLALLALVLLIGSRPPSVLPAALPAADAALAGGLSERERSWHEHARVLDATLRAAVPAVIVARLGGGAAGTLESGAGGSPHRAHGKSTDAAAARAPGAPRPARGDHALRARALPFFHSAAPPPIP